MLKFFLHISKEEQRRRLLARLDEPAKRWKFAMGDIAERKLWDKYMAAYEDMVRAPVAPQAPWYVVPADNKWFARLVVARRDGRGDGGASICNFRRSKAPRSRSCRRSARRLWRKGVEAGVTQRSHPERSALADLDTEDRIPPCETGGSSARTTQSDSSDGLKRKIYF